jgi:RNA polymerase primary sigma factor
MQAASYYDFRLGYRFSTYATYYIRQAVTRGIQDQSHLIRVPVYADEALRNAYKKGGAEIDSNPLLLSAQRARNLNSLDKPVRPGESDSATLGDLISDGNQNVHVSSAESNDARRRLEKALDTLPRREALVLRLRFGFDDGEAKTLEEVGKALGVTREWARQVEAKALKMLRSGGRRKMIEDLL